MVIVIVDGADAMDEILQIYGGHNQHGFPFDVNSDAYEEHLQMQAGKALLADMDNKLSKINKMWLYIKHHWRIRLINWNHVFN